MGNREGCTKQDEEEDDEQLRPKQASSKLNESPNRDYCYWVYFLILLCAKLLYTRTNA